LPEQCQTRPAFHQPDRMVEIGLPPDQRPLQFPSKPTDRGITCDGRIE